MDPPRNVVWSTATWRRDGRTARPFLVALSVLGYLLLQVLKAAKCMVLVVAGFSGTEHQGAALDVVVHGLG